MAIYKSCSSLAPLHSYDDECGPPFIYSITPLFSSSSSPITTHGSTTLFVGISSDDTIFTFSLVHAMGATKKNKCELKLNHVLPDAHPGVSCCAALQLAGSASPSSVAALPENFVTAGRDGVVRFWRGGGGDNDSILAPSTRSLHHEGSKPISAMTTTTHFAADESTQLIACGTETESEGPGDVEIHIWAIRVGGDGDGGGAPSQHLFRLYRDNHSGDITALRFYGGGNRALLVSGSTDGLVTFFQLDEADEDDAVLTVVNSRSAVARFSFVPAVQQPATSTNTSTAQVSASPSLSSLLPEYVCVISHDEKASLHSPRLERSSTAPPVVADEELQQQQEHTALDIRETMKSDYAIAIKDREDGSSILAVGAYKPETLAAASSSNTPYVDIYQPTGRDQSFVGDCERIARLEGAHGEEIVRDVWTSDGGKAAAAAATTTTIATIPQMILTCGEDGTIRAWIQSAGQQAHPKSKLKRDREDVELGQEEEEKEARQKIRSR